MWVITEAPTAPQRLHVGFRSPVLSTTRERHRSRDSGSDPAVGPNLELPIWSVDTHQVRLPFPCIQLKGLRSDFRVRARTGDDPPNQRCGLWKLPKLSEVGRMHPHAQRAQHPSIEEYASNIRKGCLR